ncbi:MAG: cbb3-type cytochrome c oxidase subunit I [Ilumatobacteraceae bacterium]
MTTIDHHPEAATAAVEDTSRESAIASFFVGAAQWVTTTDHKKIGRLFALTGLGFLLATAVLGAVLGAERADETNALVDADALLQLFQAYRVGLVLAVAAPVGLGLAVAVVPLQLGARSIAFPRLALTGFYSWFGGVALTMIALGRNGGSGGGDQQAVHMYLAGLGLAVLGLTAAAGCVATSVLTTRAPGMTMRRVPLFAWSSLIGALGLLLMLPVVFAVIVLLFVDLRLGLGLDGGNFGGPEGIGVWLSWAFSVPAVVVYSLPAIGVAAETMPVAFRSRQIARGVALAGPALVGVAALAATTQQFVHDVEIDTTGEVFLRGAVPFAIFAGLPLLGVTITLLIGLAGVRSGSGRPAVSAPFVASFLGLLMIGAGIAGTAVLGIVDLELVDPVAKTATVFEEGATLYLVYGSVLAALGGLTFWAPKLWGRTLPDRKMLPLAGLGLIATVLASLPLYVAGFLGQVGGVPAADADVAALLSIGSVDGGSIWTVLSLAGHAAMLLTVLAFLGLVAKASPSGSDEDPYGGHSVEWTTSSPAPHANFVHVPTVRSAEPRLDQTQEGSRP